MRPCEGVLPTAPRTGARPVCHGHARHQARTRRAWLREKSLIRLQREKVRKKPNVIFICFGNSCRSQCRRGWAAGRIGTPSTPSRPGPAPYRSAGDPGRGGSVDMWPGDEKPREKAGAAAPIRRRSRRSCASALLYLQGHFQPPAMHEEGFHRPPVRWSDWRPYHSPLSSAKSPNCA
jgi:hypothetical protein